MDKMKKNRGLVTSMCTDALISRSHDELITPYYASIPFILSIVTPSRPCDRNIADMDVGT